MFMMKREPLQVQNRLVLNYALFPIIQNRYHANGTALLDSLLEVYWKQAIILVSQKQI